MLTLGILIAWLCVVGPCVIRWFRDRRRSTVDGVLPTKEVEELENWWDHKHSDAALIRSLQHENAALQADNDVLTAVVDKYIKQRETRQRTFDKEQIQIMSAHEWLEHGPLFNVE